MGLFVIALGRRGARLNAVRGEDLKMRVLILGLFLGVWASASTAQNVIVEYFSLLGPVDAVNSRGAPLNDLCAIAQQDRANWHRFKKREQSDSGDWFFDSTDRRAMMAGKCVYDRNYFANPGQRIRNGSRSFYVYVRVLGSNGVVSRVEISEGAG